MEWLWRQLAGGSWPAQNVGDPMAESTSTETARKLIGSLADSEKSALDAARRFVDTVNDTVPDTSEDGPRSKIIDSAFRMTQELVDAGNRLAMNVVDSTEDAVGHD